MPKAVAGIIPKREFKQVLGATKAEALARYPVFHARVEREIAEAKLSAARTAGAHSPSTPEREAYAVSVV